jgi:hypothetical protein
MRTMSPTAHIPTSFKISFVRSAIIFSCILY